MYIKIINTIYYKWNSITQGLEILTQVLKILKYYSI